MSDTVIAFLSAVAIEVGWVLWAKGIVGGQRLLVSLLATAMALGTVVSLKLAFKDDFTAGGMILGHGLGAWLGMGIRVPKHAS